jgi:hypothetical protein
MGKKFTFLEQETYLTNCCVKRPYRCPWDAKEFAQQPAINFVIIVPIPELRPSIARGMGQWELERGRRRFKCASKYILCMPR